MLPEIKDWEDWDNIDADNNDPAGTTCALWIVNDEASWHCECHNIANYIQSNGIGNLIGKPKKDLYGTIVSGKPISQTDIALKFVRCMHNNLLAETEQYIKI